MKHPVRPMLCGWKDAPASPDAPYTWPSGYAFEIKYDGYRLVAAKDGDKVVLYTRAGRFVTNEYPEIVASIRTLPVEKVVLDGEILVLRDGWPSFQDLQNRMSLPTARRAADLRFNAYDLLQLNDIETGNLPYLKRREALVALVKHAGPNVQTGPSSTDGAAMWAMVEKHSLEGLIAKPLDSRYMQGERGTWLKIKRLVTSEFVVIGFTKGEGKREGFFGNLMLAEERDGALVACGSAGTGYTDVVLADLTRRLGAITRESVHPAIQKAPRDRATWVEPTLRVLVRYPDRSDAGNVRMASYQGLAQ